MGSLLTPLGDLFGLLFRDPILNMLMLIYAGASHLMAAGSFAVALIILTLIIRSCLIPLTRRQIKSSREMQVLQPKLKELQTQYRSDPQALMAAQRELYKEHGVSPLSGCLPLLIQMPFLYAIYGAFLLVFNFDKVGKTNVTESIAHHIARINEHLYPFVPHLHALPHTEFFWANLGQMDRVLPVIAALLTLVQLRMAMPVRKKPAPGSTPDTTAQATQATMYIMPVFTLIFGFQVAAGLALYWCITTLFSIVQTYFLSGLGSLFVGIPGMEHLVPAPKEIGAPSGGALAVAGPGGARALAAPGRTVTPALPTAPVAEGGMRGMFKQIRESMAAAQAQQAERQQQAATTPPTVDAARSNGTSKGDGDGSFVVSRSDEGNGAGQAARERRVRPAKTGPMLVKPPTNGASADLPEARIARDAANGGTPGAGLNGPRKNANGNGAGGPNGRSNTTSGRQRNGRPKGSR